MQGVRSAYTLHNACSHVLFSHAHNWPNIHNGKECQKMMFVSHDYYLAAIAAD